MEELENLYNVISGEGLYTKSFDEFKTQFSEVTYQDKVFKAVSEKGFYTKDINSFKQKYVSKTLSTAGSRNNPLVGIESVANAKKRGDGNYYKNKETDQLYKFTGGKYNEISNLNLENYKSDVEITKEDVEKGEGNALRSIIPKLEG